MKTIKQAMQEITDMVFEEFVPFMLGKRPESQKSDAMKLVTNKATKIMEETDREFVNVCAARHIILDKTKSLKEIVDMGKIIGLKPDQILDGMKEAKEIVEAKEKAEESQIVLSN